MSKYYMKCSACGKFINTGELKENGGASYLFIPDSEVSYEENRWHCKICTEKNGAPIPSQGGMNWAICQTIY